MHDYTTLTSTIGDVTLILRLGEAAASVTGAHDFALEQIREWPLLGRDRRAALVGQGEQPLVHRFTQIGTWQAIEAERYTIDHAGDVARSNPRVQIGPRVLAVPRDPSKDPQLTPGEPADIVALPDGSQRYNLDISVEGSWLDTGSVYYRVIHYKVFPGSVARTGFIVQFESGRWGHSTVRPGPLFDFDDCATQADALAALVTDVA